MVVLGEIFWGAAAAALLVFAVVSLYEGERLAFRRAGGAAASAGLILAAGLAAGPGPARYFFALSALTAVVGSAWLLFSPRPRRYNIITGPHRRIDERDTIFARFALQPGSPQMESYYRARPDLRDIDDEIRRSPSIYHGDHFNRNPVLSGLAQAQDEYLKRQLSLVDGPVRESQIGGTPERNTAVVKSVIRYLGAPLCGITRLEKSFLYSYVGRGPEPYGQAIESDHPFAVAFALEMKSDMIAASPGPAVYTETETRYTDVARIALASAEFLRRLGWSARAHISGSNYQALLTPLAWQAGLGELGRMGILITPDFGPRIRLGLITTDFPMIEDTPVSFGVQDFCRRCQKCALNCPGHAIPSGDPIPDNGVVRWVIRREECYRFWGKAGSDCSRCVFVCPYSKPANPLHDAIRWAASHSRAAQRMCILGDDGFYGLRPRTRTQSLLSSIAPPQ